MPGRVLFSAEGDDLPDVFGGFNESAERKRYGFRISTALSQEGHRESAFLRLDRNILEKKPFRPIYRCTDFR